MAQLKYFDDSKWVEVKHLNGYAVLLGYLSMAVRGLGFLVVTWTTVVLLGGFVSVLKKKDFWCLTVITLIQTAGVIDVILIEKVKYVGYSSKGLEAVGNLLIRNRLAGRPATFLRGVAACVQILLGWVIAWAQFLVFFILYFIPVYALFVFGVLITTVVSLWRLIEHDYGNADGDPSKANMNPALDVLYTLTLVQGMIFVYRIILMFAGKRLVNEVASKYGFKGQAIALVSDYLKEMGIGCRKNPSFAKGRNLVTYAVDLMGPTKSAHDYRSGTRILSVVIRSLSPDNEAKVDGQDKLIKGLIMSHSSSYVLQKLLWTLDSRSRPYDRQMRYCAASIVALVAEEIRLEQFPQGIQCISSLIETFEDWYQQDQYQQGRPLSSDSDDCDPRTDYTTQLAHGLVILEGLANDENNCRVISETQGLLPKIMAPLTSDLIHQNNHEAYSLVKNSVSIICRLVDSPGTTGVKLRQEVWRNKKVISTMEWILKCEDYNCNLQILAIRILTQLYADEKGREEFIKLLVDIFTDDSRDSSIRKTAGEGLAKLSLESAGDILKANDDIGVHLSKMLLDAENQTYKVTAAKILDLLCSRYTMADECFTRLKVALTNAMPQVLGEVFSCGLTGNETHKGINTAYQGRFAQPDSDIENQCDDPQDTGEGKASFSSHQQNNKQSEDKHQEEEFKATLLSLCVMVCDTMISADQDLTHQFDTLNPGNGSSFPMKLKEMVEKMMDPRPTCLRMLKLATQMVISMMKHKGSYLKQDMESLMESLSSASIYMYILDVSMICFNGDGGGTEPLRSLVSLVEEAQELVEKYEPAEIEVLAVSTSVSGNAN